MGREKGMKAWTVEEKTKGSDVKRSGSLAISIREKEKEREDK